MDSIDLKYAKSILLELSKKEVSKKIDLANVIKSHQVLDNLLSSLQEDGYIEIKETQIGHKTYSVKLTRKGQLMIKPLRETDAISKGQKLPETDKYALILYLYRNGSKNMKEINEDLPGSTEILRDLEKLKIIRQEINKSNYPQETTLMLTEKGREIGEMLEKVEGKMEE